MRGGRCCSQGGRYAGTGVGWGTGITTNVGKEAPGFVVPAGPSTADAVGRKERGEWSRRISDQRRGALGPS